MRRFGLMIVIGLQAWACGKLAPLADDGGLAASGDDPARGRSDGDAAASRPGAVDATPPACPDCPSSSVDFSALPPIVGAWDDAAPLVRARYVSDGDSIPFGYYAPAGQTFTALAAAFAGDGIEFEAIAYAGAGITGPTGEDATFAARVLPLVRTDVPTIVSQNAGVNDSNASPDEVWAAQSHYCAQVRAAGAKCILVSLLPREGNSYGRRDAIRQLQHDHWAEVADGFVDTSAIPEIADASDRRWFVDGLHPTPSGHVAMMRHMLPVLLDVLADAGVN